MKTDWAVIETLVDGTLNVYGPFATTDKAEEWTPDGSEEVDYQTVPLLRP